MAETSVPIIRVDEWELRRIFNDLRIPERAECGELRAEVKRSRPATDGSIRDWVPGTLSQEVRYYDGENNLVAKAHRYLRPDGTLAASGKPDPKRVMNEGIIYILRGSGGQ
jgi:hypothetical protein